MNIPVHTVTVGLLTPMLQNLSDILDKAVAYAEAKKFDPLVLFNARLAPDMLPLSRQVQLSSDFAKGIVARLAGVEAPKLEDTERTFEELKARLAKTVDYVSTFTPQSFDGAMERDIKIPGRDRTWEMKGEAFLHRWALPNFFFHVTTAYAILRHNGVDLGKKDFVKPPA